MHYTFYDVASAEPSHDSITVKDQEMKLNIGAELELSPIKQMETLKTP